MSSPSITMTTGKLHGLFYRTYVPGGDALPKGVVIVTHGYSEHSGRYDQLCRESILTSNWAAVSYDVRGHGQSVGTRGYIKNFSTYLEDLQSIQEQLAEMIQTETGSLMFLAHSMGGLITLRYLLELRKKKPHKLDKVRGVFLSAPFLRVSVPLTLTQRVMVTVINKIHPKFKNPFAEGFEKHLSHDESYHKTRPVDEHCFSHATFGWLMECERAQRYVQKHSAGLQGIPTYWFVAGLDLVCCSVTMREFAARLQDDKAQVYEYPDFFHEIFQEKNRAEPFARIREVLSSRL